MSPSRPDLLALLCPACGLALDVAPGAEVFPCPRCRVAFEASAEGLAETRVLTARPTSDLAAPAHTRYVAVWRFLAAVEVRQKRAEGSAHPGLAWDQVRRAAAPELPALYVPAFTLTRVTVQQLGAALVRAQPRLELREGLPEVRLPAPLPGDPAMEREEAPGFGGLSPVLLSRADAATAAHFVYLAVEAWSTRGLRSIDYGLELTGGELLYLPAEYDRRLLSGSLWRFLLREFDCLTA